jgi:hypothetical protein
LKNDVFYRPREPTLVLGRVELWGHVVEATFGHRGQHAYPARLYLIAMSGPVEQPALRDAADDLASAYGVPTSLAARWEYF